MRRMINKPRVLLVGWDGADWHLANPLIEQGLLAVMLVQNAFRLNCHTDLRMVHPRAKERSGHLNLILLADALRRGIKAGYTTTTLTVNTGRDRETRRLAERSGGRLLKSVDLWTLDL